MLFYFFAAIAVIASLLVIAQRNPVYSVLLLIASFGALSGLYILLDAPFVAVVNEQLVKDAFPGVDPIGRTIRAGLDSLTRMTIVGIVKDIRTRGPARPVQAEIYFPYEQHPGPATALNLVVRASRGEPLAAGAAVAKLIRSRHAEMPVRLESMTTTLAAATATPRFRTALPCRMIVSEGCKSVSGRVVQRPWCLRLCLHPRQLRHQARVACSSRKSRATRWLPRRMPVRWR